jgi:hypothetical protein
MACIGLLENILKAAMDGSGPPTNLLSHLVTIIGEWENPVTQLMLNTAPMQISAHHKISPLDIGTTNDVLHQDLNSSANKMTN